MKVLIIRSYNISTTVQLNYFLFLQRRMGGGYTKYSQ